MKDIFTGNTIEEAKNAAAEAFGVSRDLIAFSVIKEPKVGLFGKIKESAQIEAEYNPPTKADVVAAFLKNVLDKMGIENAGISFEETDDGISVELSGDGLDELIGKKGELIEALQYLSSLVSNKIDREYYRIVIDCGNFRERRREYLEKTAKKLAETVKKTGRTCSLEPMNPYERRIVHSAASEIEGVSTRSVGEEPYRKVLISSTEKKRFNSKSGGYKSKGGRRNGGRREKPKPHYDITTSFEKNYKKPKPEDDMDLGSGEYGKIDI